MRVTKFRGISYTTGDWVYGYFIKAITGYCEIVYQDELSPLHGFIKHHVIPESVGEFIGLLDVDGNPIYESDILHVVGKEHNWNAVVKWNQQQAAFWLRAIPTNHYTEFMTLAQHGDGTGIWIDSARIIGNSFENPDLLEKQPT